MRLSKAVLPTLLASIALAQPVPPAPPAAPVPPVPPRPMKIGSDMEGFHKDFNFAFDKGPAKAMGPFHLSEGDQHYDRALRALDNRRWSDALDAFARVQGDRADGALHWKAYALAQLDRRDDALATLADLRRGFAASRWLPEAQALEGAIRRGAATETASEIEEDLKLLALNGLVQSDPDRAAPLVEGILKSSSSRRLRERALHVVARSETQRGQALLTQVARGKVGNPDLQVQAIRHLGRSQSADHRPLLTEIYNSSADAAMKRAVIDALSAQDSAPTLVALARKETDPALRREMVRRLSRMRTKEANDFMAELLK